jgi:hypothetical protein
MVVTCIAIVLFYILNLVKTRKDGSIFTAGLISAYIAYLGWSAMASRPDAECNPFKESTPNLISQIVVGASFTFFSLFSISFMSNEQKAESSNGAKRIVSEDVEDSKATQVEDITLRDGSVKTAEEAAIFPVTKQSIIF